MKWRETVENLIYVKAVRFNRAFYDRCHKTFTIRLCTFCGGDVVKRIRLVNKYAYDKRIYEYGPSANFASWNAAKDNTCTLAIDTDYGFSYYIPVENGRELDAVLYNELYMEVDDEIFDIFSDLIEIKEGPY